MELLIPHTCSKCGTYDEALLIEGTIHFKQICKACGVYVKFFPKKSLPDINIIKKHIWKMCGEKMDAINRYKEECSFPTKEQEYLYNMNLKYYSLYVFMRMEYMDEN